MAIHDTHGFNFGSGEDRFIAVLNSSDPSEPVYQSLAKDEHGGLHAVMVRQNWASLEFLVCAPAIVLDKARSNPNMVSFARAARALRAAQSADSFSTISFMVNSSQGELAWINPTTRTPQIVADKFLDSTLDYTGRTSCRVVGADRTKRGMISHMHIG